MSNADGRLGPYRVLDLSAHIRPDESERTCDVTSFFQPETGDWHSTITMESHLGTHVETPLHYYQGAFRGPNSPGPDILGLPFTAFMGRGVLLRLECEPRTYITVDMLTKAAGGRVRPGDVILLDSPTEYYCTPFTDNPKDFRPHLSLAAADWMVDHDIKAVTVGEAVAIERSVIASCEFHRRALAHNILLVEVVCRLNELRDDVVFVTFQPPPIGKLDSCCVRLIAIEGIPGFRPGD